MKHENTANVFLLKLRNQLLIARNANYAAAGACAGCAQQSTTVLSLFIGLIRSSKDKDKT
ncbi:hypothetical protein CSA80_01585 [Candidatus Saccharibacteria bacterium]|nr:MAG: hypothetical protein CSA80_01585 [Candidatus Saccharibacteria bacterium]